MNSFFLFSPQRTCSIHDHHWKVLLLITPGCFQALIGPKLLIKISQSASSFELYVMFPSAFSLWFSCHINLHKQESLPFLPCVFVQKSGTSQGLDFISSFWIHTGAYIVDIFPFIYKIHLKNKTRHILFEAPFIGQILHCLTSVIVNLLVTLIIKLVTSAYDLASLVATSSYGLQPSLSVLSFFSPQDKRWSLFYKSLCKSLLLICKL